MRGASCDPDVLGRFRPRELTVAGVAMFQSSSAFQTAVDQQCHLEDGPRSLSLSEAPHQERWNQRHSRHVPLKPTDDIDPTDPMTWASLLARWMDLARTSQALVGQPGIVDRRAVPALITFEAIAMAMQHLGGLTATERNFALDQAAVLLDARRADLEDAFDELPGQLLQAEIDAVRSIDEARRSFAWTILWEGPGPLVMPDVTSVPARASDDGMVAVMLPNTLALPGEPIAWWLGRDEPMLARGIAGCRATPLDQALQVWRAFDETGRAIEDRVRDVSDDGPLGAVPLIVPRLLDGCRLEVPTLSDAWPPMDEKTLEPTAPPVRWDVDRDW